MWSSLEVANGEPMGGWISIRTAEGGPTVPVFGHFRDIVVSGIEKIAKPDPAIFALAEARFGHAPGAMLFIDDNAANITAAAALGWQVHHFRDAALLREDLSVRGLIG